MINRLKIFLTRFRAARWIANLKNGTLHMLRHGYHPREFWDEWADRFAHHRYQRELHESNRWLLEHVRQARPTEILEVGCGFGRNLKMFHDSLGYPCRLFGVDLSLQLLRKGRQELGPAVPFVCGDINRLPFDDRSIEAVVTHGVLMHVPPASVREALRELLRVARKTLWLIEEQVLTPAARGSSFSINEYTFAHDYDALFRELGVRPAQIEYDGKVVVLIRMRIDVG